VVINLYQIAVLNAAFFGVLLTDQHKLAVLYVEYFTDIGICHLRVQTHIGMRAYHMQLPFLSIAQILCGFEEFGNSRKTLGLEASNRVTIDFDLACLGMQWVSFWILVKISVTHPLTGLVWNRHMCNPL